MAFIHQFGFTGAILNLPAVLLILVLTAVLIVGVRESSNTNAIMVGVKVVVVLLVIAFGASHIDQAQFQTVSSQKYRHLRSLRLERRHDRLGHHLLRLYPDLDPVSVAAQETKNPQHAICPIGILLSLFICTILYMLISVVLLGMAYYPTMANSANPVSFAVGKIASLKWR